MWSARRTTRRKAVLFVTHEHSSGEASLRYRSVHHAESLAFLGVSCDVTRYGAPDLLSAIGEYECIVLHRFPWDAAAPLVRRARKLGKLLVSDTDDLVFDPAFAHHIEAIEDMSGGWREAWAESYRTTIEECGSGATASTETLCRHLLSLTSRVEVLPNVVNEEMIRLAAHARGTKPSPDGDEETEVAIAYFSGSLTHRGDFDDAAGAVAWALETYPQVRFVAVGRLELDERFARFAARIERIPWQPWQALAELHARTDINLAPLAGNAFSECKSCVKYLEAALVGVPTVASARGDFTRVIQHGQNGLLAGDAAGWRDALRQLVEDPALRRELGRAALDDVHANHTTRARLATVAEAWRSLAGARTRDEEPLTVDWLVGAHLEPSNELDVVLRLARSLAEKGHAVRICAEPGDASALLEGLDPGAAVIALGHFEDLTSADARIATDTATAYGLADQPDTLFKFRLVQRREKRGLELPLRSVCLDARVAAQVSELARRPVEYIDPADAGAQLDRVIRAACFLRLRGD